LVIITYEIELRGKMANPEQTKIMLAATPPMGWNSWNQFGAHIHEDLVKGTAEAFISSGMLDAGYNYVVIDDLWHGGRDENGRLFPDPVKFPHGIKALADYVHSLGLKFGIYSDAGTKTCAGCPGSRGFEELDAQTFASWDVDYLKYDFCYTEDNRAYAERAYTAMGSALQATGRPIVFSVCEWGHHSPWLWAKKAGGHLWRTTGDICDSWKDGSVTWCSGVESIGFEQQRGLEVYAGPGHWNDPDMLVVGLYGKSKTIPGAGCTDNEYRSHMSLWCLLAAPLMVGCDIRTMNPVTRDILMNREIIALDQDVLGKQGYRACRVGRSEVWKKTLVNKALGVGIFNRGDTPQTVTVHWSDLEISGHYQIRDLWEHLDTGESDSSYTTEVEPHGCKVLRLSPEG
jgi:alpha-galactosidase